MSDNIDRSVGPVTLQGPGWVSTVAFRSMHVSEQLSEPFKYEVELLSTDVNLTPDDVLGQALTVTIEAGMSKRHHNGIVTRLARLGTLGEFFHYRMVMRPWLWLLSRTTNCRIFQEMSVPDIVKKVFREHGFSDFEESLTGSYPPREFVVQYRETDLNFVRRLLEHEGIYFYFKHETTVHTLVLCDSISAHSPTPFHKSLPYLPPNQNRSALVEYVESWQTVSDVETGAYVLTDYDFEQPRVSLEVKKSFVVGNAHGEYEAFDYPGDYKKTGEGERYAMMRIEELHTSRTRAEGESNARGLLPGSLFTLAEHPVEPSNRDYLVVAIDATIRSHELESGTADPGEVYRCRFSAIESDRSFRPPRVTPRPLIQGVQTARVVGKDGEEIWTDQYGRVKLEFHWDRQSPGNENSSCWVRVSQAWAGASFGALHTPRIGQEVLVEFLEGDPDRPIVTGRVYNFDNMPPYELPMEQTKSGIKSQSTKDGSTRNFNEIRFEDKIGQEELFIHAEKTQTTKVKGSQSISVDGSRSVSVGGDETYGVTGTRTTTITKDETQKFLAKRTMDVTDTNTDTIHQLHTANYNNGRTVNVSGADDALNVSGVNRNVLVDGEYNIVATQKYILSHKDNALLLESALSMLTNGKCTLSFDGSAAVLTAADELRLECGGASITLTKDGTITINAAQTVTASGAQGALELGPTGGKLSGLVATVSGTTLSEMTGAMVKIN
jgi:type VI secretion system secreted protein VgrG